METTQSEPTQKKITRREFLKIAGLSAAGGWLVLQRWVSENGPASLISSFLTRDLKSDTPSEFLNEREDPNPFFENSDQLLERSFKLYNKLREKDPSRCPQLTLTRRKNYIRSKDVLQRYRELSPKDIADTPDIDILGERLVIAVKSLSPTFGEGADQSTGGDILSFSAGGIDNIHVFLQTDPGSGFINRAINKNFGISRDEFYAKHPLENGFSEDVAQKMHTSVVEDLASAMNHFKMEHEKSNQPIDFAEVLTYFYATNQGDIYSGLWDSVVFFKLFVRNNLTTLQPEATYCNQSMFLGEMFKDTFSPRNSLNWLARKYRDKGIDGDHPLAGSGFMESQHFKDFMVVNRSGGLYHGLNILTWAAVCMDPLLVEAVTAAYFSGPKGISIDNVTEHGPLKIQSDLIVAMKSPEIRRAVDRYVKIE